MRSVIPNDQLKISVRLIEGALDRFLDILVVVKRCQNYGDFRHSASLFRMLNKFPASARALPDKSMVRVSV